MVFVSQLNGDRSRSTSRPAVLWSTNIERRRPVLDHLGAALLQRQGLRRRLGRRVRDPRSLTALDAKTGKIEWRFWTTPAPNETGGDTWPKGTDAYKHGGASIWNTPTVNRKPAGCSSRPRTRRHGSATNDRAKTSSPHRSSRWTPKPANTSATSRSPPRLWTRRAEPDRPHEGEMNGKEVEAVGERRRRLGLRRGSGKLQAGLPDPRGQVPQDPSQNTWPTQPEPTMEPFSPIEATPERWKRRRSGRLGPNRRKSWGASLHPAELGPERDQPGRELRGRWRQLAAVLVRPRKDMYFVCSQSGALGLVVPPHPQAYKEGENSSAPTRGRNRLRHDGLPDRLRHSTGKIKWQNELKANHAIPAGDDGRRPLFVARRRQPRRLRLGNRQRTLALADRCRRNTTVTPFEDEGEEKIAFYAAATRWRPRPTAKILVFSSRDGGRSQRPGSRRRSTEHAGEESAEEKEGGVKPATPKKAAARKWKARRRRIGRSGRCPERGSRQRSVRRKLLDLPRRDRHGGNGGPDLRTMPLAKEQAGAERGMPPPPLVTCFRRPPVLCERIGAEVRPPLPPWPVAPCRSSSFRRTLLCPARVRDTARFGRFDLLRRLPLSGRRFLRRCRLHRRLLFLRRIPHRVLGASSSLPAFGFFHRPLRRRPRNFPVDVARQRVAAGGRTRFSLRLRLRRGHRGLAPHRCQCEVLWPFSGA